MVIYTQNTFTVGYTGPWSVMDNLAFVCTHQRAEIRGAKFNNKQKEKAEWIIQESPRVSPEQPQLLHPTGFLSQWGTASSMRLHLHRTHKAQHPTSRARGEPTPGEEQSWHPQPWQQQAKRHTWKPGSPREDTATSAGWCWEHGVPSQASRFESHLCHLGAVWPEVSYWTSACLGFIILSKGEKNSLYLLGWLWGKTG